jgi:glycogen operon protein
LRKRHPVLRAGEFLCGRPCHGSPHNDITWLRADGAEMTGPDWAEPAYARLAFHLAGAAGSPPILVLMNGEPTAAPFVLPGSSFGLSWRVAVDTRAKTEVGATLVPSTSVPLDAGALLVLTSDSV